MKRIGLLMFLVGWCLGVRMMSTNHPIIRQFDRWAGIERPEVKS